MKVQLCASLKFLLILIFFSGGVHAIERTQIIKLSKGWNSVYLEVDPVIQNQDLTGYMGTATPIQVIATYYPAFSSVEYISDPNEAEWKKPSWNKWIHKDLPDAFLSNLYDLEGGRGYLIKSTKDYDWSVTGTVQKLDTRWQPKSFNLIGFQVQEIGPSFHQLFSASTTATPLQQGPVYRLINNQWEKASLPDTEVNKGEAYWVFNDGQTAFQGVVEVTVQSGKKVIDFSDLVESQTLTLTNTSTSESPLNITLTLINNTVPLSLKGAKEGDGDNEESYQITYTPVTDAVDTVTLEAGESKDLTLSVRRSEIVGADEQTGLLKITVAETYEEFWLPISAYGVDAQ